MLNNLKGKIWIVLGTRPELIKQLPVYYQCIKKIGKKNVLLVNSGQHKNFLSFYSKENKIKFDLILNNLQSTSSLIRNLKKSVKVFYNLFLNLTNDFRIIVRIYFGKIFFANCFFRLILFMLSVSDIE